MDRPTTVPTATVTAPAPPAAGRIPPAAVPPTTPAEAAAPEAAAPPGIGDKIS